MPHRQNQNGVGYGLVAVEGEITGLSARDHEFAQIVFCRTSHQRVVCQNLHGFDDQRTGILRSRRIGIEQEIDESLQVRECPARVY